MTLIIIDAADVREGEPRWWFTTEAEARYWRTRPAEERGRFHDEYAKVPTGTASH